MRGPGCLVQNFTDPLNDGDKPYAGGYRIDACRHDVEGTGFDEGQVVKDAGLVDQHDDVVHTNDFCDQVILLDFSAGWCGVCQAEAPKLQALYAEQRENGFMALTVYMENVDGSEPTAEEAKAWTDEYGLEFPVMVDDGTFYNGFASATGESTIGLPLMVLIDHGLVVRKSMGTTHEDVLDLLAE